MTICVKVAEEIEIEQMCSYFRVEPGFVCPFFDDTCCARQLLKCTVALIDFAKH